MRSYLVYQTLNIISSVVVTAITNRFHMKTPCVCFLAKVCLCWVACAQVRMNPCFNIEIGFYIKLKEQQHTHTHTHVFFYTCTCDLCKFLLRQFTYVKWFCDFVFYFLALNAWISRCKANLLLILKLILKWLYEILYLVSVVFCFIVLTFLLTLPTNTFTSIVIPTYFRLVCSAS